MKGFGTNKHETKGVATTDNNHDINTRDYWYHVNLIINDLLSVSGWHFNVVVGGFAPFSIYLKSHNVMSVTRECWAAE